MTRRVADTKAEGPLAKNSKKMWTSIPHLGASSRVSTKSFIVEPRG